MTKLNATQNTSITPTTDNSSHDTTLSSENPILQSLPFQGMSRASQLLPFLPFGSTTLWAWSRNGRFPAPVKLSPTMTAWRNADVHSWLASPTIVISEEV